MKDKLAIRLEGRAAFFLRDADGKIIKEWHFKNAIQPSAKDITAKRLIAHPSSAIDVISLHYQGNLLKANPITSTAIVDVAQVSFSTTFLPADFNSAFDEARLVCSGIDEFSKIIDLVSSKTGAQSLLVTWTIQII